MPLYSSIELRNENKGPPSCGNWNSWGNPKVSRGKLLEIGRKYSENSNNWINCKSKSLQNLQKTSIIKSSREKQFKCARKFKCNQVNVWKLMLEYWNVWLIDFYENLKICQNFKGALNFFELIFQLRCSNMLHAL